MLTSSVLASSSVAASSAVAGAVGSNSRALWYSTRGFGLIALVLLTATLVMGLTQVVRYARPGFPRFVISALHKNISLLALVFLGIHIVTAVADTFAPITIVSVFIPFAGKYRPLWLGLGALSLDLMIALIVTSLLRERIGHRTWKAVHWAAYLTWPLAVVHGLGTGSDTKLGWVLAINAACIAAGVAAIWWRLAQGWAPVNSGRRGAAVAATVLIPLVVAAWTFTGPLKAGWAKRAGTPKSLLGASAAASSSAGTSSAASSGAKTAAPSLSLPINTSFTATQRESGFQSNGLVSVTIDGTFSGGTFVLVLTGQPADDGGVQLTGSQVSLGPAGAPSDYQGHVTNLNGNTVVASLSDSSGNSLTLTLQITTNDRRSLSGTIEASR